MDAEKPAGKNTSRRRVAEMEVIIYDIRRDTPDTTTLFLFAGNEPPAYAAGRFLTIDPHQFAELKHFTAHLEDLKGQREKPRAYSLASAPHERLLAITVKEEPYIGGETPYPPLISPLLAYHIPVGRRLIIKGFTGAYVIARRHHRPHRPDRPPMRRQWHRPQLQLDQGKSAPQRPAETHFAL